MGAPAVYVVYSGALLGVQEVPIWVPYYWAAYNPPRTVVPVALEVEVSSA